MNNNDNEYKCEHEWSWVKFNNNTIINSIDSLGIRVKCDKCGLEAIEWWEYCSVKDNNGNILD